MNVKNVLLEMARNGEPKPKRGKHEYGWKLHSYLNKSKNTYDPVVEREIRKFEAWFPNNPARIKEVLLEMARNGEPKPKRGKHEYGHRLASYVSENSPVFDPVFNNEIRKFEAWFPNNPARIKEVLLGMAERGEPKPKRGESRLVERLYNYTSKSSKDYDAVFDAKIRGFSCWFPR